MSQQTVDINVFKGLISTADPKDIPYEQASDCANIDFSSIAGGIQGLQLDVLDYRSATPINRGMSVLQPLFPTDPTYTQDRYFFGVRKLASPWGKINGRYGYTIRKRKRYLSLLFR
jgi:hypothetical protein